MGEFECSRQTPQRPREPGGRAKARPMTGSAKQPRSRKKELDCFVARAPRNDELEFANDPPTSLRAPRSNSRAARKNWIASSQVLLAMTMRRLMLRRSSQ